MKTLANLPHDDIVQAVMRALDVSKTIGHHKRLVHTLHLDGVYREAPFCDTLAAELEIRLAKLETKPAV